jgi:hypothetical protein
MLSNDTFLRALKREPTPYTPIWLMRQAGRYLPEYKETRARAGSFMGLAGNPALATEVTLQPLDRYPLDAAILFSDILTIPDAMGLGLSFAEGEGPRFARTTRDETSIRALAVPDMAKLRYVFDAVREIKRALKGRVPLIGFAGSPFTLACYMIEGSGSADFARVRQMAHARPDLLAHLVRTNTRAVTAYLNEQIAAGADAVARRNRRSDERSRWNGDPLHRLHQGWWRMDRGNRRYRRFRGRSGLDRRYRRRATQRGPFRGAAGQSRPCGPPDRSHDRRPRSDEDPPRSRPRAGAYLQSGARHHPRHAA